MAEAIDITSKVLTLLVLLLASVFVAWQCFDGLAKVTTIGAEFRHFIVNRRNFDRWLKMMHEQERGLLLESALNHLHKECPVSTSDFEPGAILMLAKQFGWKEGG